MLTGASGLPAMARTRGSRSAEKVRTSSRPWMIPARRSAGSEASRGSLDGSQCDSPPLATSSTRPGSAPRIAAPSARPSATQRSIDGNGGAAVLTTSGTSGRSVPPRIMS